MSDPSKNPDSTKAEKPTTETDGETQPELEEKWLIRDCDLYDAEYSECTSLKGRFHQYFIFGKSLDCNQWKKDYDNCCKWVDKKNVKAGEAVIKSEKARRFARFRAHYQNDVWKKRDGPPSDWDKPLPEWMRKRDENTYLAQKAKEMKDGTIVEDESFCCIM
ncbi:UPF0545 protein C22orf39 homolog [Aricia agestis]|uniref:UPF0545 protein C22orf39 homolog n=1 Tax=Aricia agestis TaxID=91739 RepID=UPI001C2063F7|nr:UPF0545 protein C22orf39 homolog [Aricia agestis]